MSTTASETSTQPAAAGPVTDSQDHLTGFFDYPDPDIIFRSSDLHEFRLRKVYVVESSTVLRHLLTQTTPEARLPDAPPTPAEDGSASLPVVQLPDSSLILSSLFSFVFPVLSVLPPEVDQVMELISVAQKYKMDSVVARIRDRTSSKWAKLIPEESALRAFDLARRYGLQEEATTAARRTLGLSITMQSLEDKLDGMSGTTLYELWKYHQEVKRILKANIAEFILSEKFNEFVATIRQGKACCAYYSKQTPSVPQWLEDYLNFVTSFPGYSLDPTKFHTALRRHISISLSSGKARSFVRCTACANITEASVRSFWLGLEATAMRSMEVADDYLHPGEGTSPHDRENLLESATPSLNRFNARDGDAVLRSSDLTNFRVHKSILEIASPLFRDMFSLPQSGDVETVGGIPILHVSEEAEVLNSLITMLYPVPPATPDSWDKLLPLLSAAQKYDMDHILSSLRSSISREDIPPPAGKETFRVYAIASKLRLDSEVKLSARLTLHHPMTFEFLGEDLPLFEGASLYDLAQLRIRCRDALLTCFRGLRAQGSSDSCAWAGKPPPTNTSQDTDDEEARCESFEDKTIFPEWLSDILSGYVVDLDKDFTKPLPAPDAVSSAILNALTAHVREKECTFCTRVYFSSGVAFCDRVKGSLHDALDEELDAFFGDSGTEFSDEAASTSGSTSE